MEDSAFSEDYFVPATTVWIDFNLTPIAAAYGLNPLDLPPKIQVLVLETHDLVERV